MIETIEVLEHGLTLVERDEKGYGDGLDDVWRCSCGLEFAIRDLAEAFDHGRETAPPPVTLVVVEGGIARTVEVRGKVDVVHVDWDNVDSGDMGAIVREIEEIERLPDDFADKATMLQDATQSLRHALLDQSVDP
jgi:hypothetical protein